MGAGVPQSTINRHLRRLKKKNPGVKYVVLRASNGEVAIVEVAIVPKHKDFIETAKSALATEEVS